MKARLALITFALIAAIGGYVWHSQQPDQQAKKVVSNLMEALEYQSSNLRSREDVHDVIQETVADQLRLEITDPPPGFNAPEKISNEGLQGRLDKFHALVTKREFQNIETTVEVISKEARVTRIEKITAGNPLFGIDTQTWKITFDLRHDESWKIIAIAAQEIE